VPYDLAFSMPTHEVTAHAIVFSEFEGSTFNWHTMAFEKRE